MSGESPSESSPSFEASLELLQTIVHELEEGNLGLEPSLNRFEEGIRLLRNCYQILERSEQRIEILTGTDEEGRPLAERFDVTATLAPEELPVQKPVRRRAVA